MKGLETLNSTIIFSKTSTETLPMKKPKNPEFIPSNIVCQSKLFIHSGVLYIIRLVRRSKL